MPWISTPARPDTHVVIHCTGDSGGRIVAGPMSLTEAYAYPLPKPAWCRVIMSADNPGIVRHDDGSLELAEWARIYTPLYVATYLAPPPRPWGDGTPRQPSKLRDFGGEW